MIYLIVLGFIIFGALNFQEWRYKQDRRRIEAIKDNKYLIEKYLKM
jgi:hypothetical protein